MRRICLFVLVLFGCFAQPPVPRGLPPTGDEEGKLPNGKSQHEEIAKADYKKNLDDAIELAKLADELKTDIERDDRYVISVKSIKKTEDIDKLAKSIRGRLKRF